MKKLAILITTLLLVFTMSGCKEDDVFGGPVPVIEVECKTKGFEYDYDTLTYELVWQDEFDGDTLDLENWRYEINGYGGGNNELQYYTDQNAIVEDGVLKIIAKKEDYSTWKYTSSRITTQNRETFKYGKIEIRSIQPAGRGTWAAHWMMPSDSIYGGWPNSGEIDIMEFVGYQPSSVHATIHTDYYNHIDGTSRGSVYDELDVAPAEGYHIYTVEWLPDKMIFSVDDIEYFTYDPGKYSTCPDYKSWPFDQQFFLIFNIAIGGDWGGAYGVDDTIFPTTMTVDYVRVYQATEFDEYQ